MVSHSLSILDSHPLHDRLTLSFRVGQRHSLQPATLWALLTTDQPHTQDVTDAQRERRLGVNSMAPTVDAMSSWCSAWPMRQLSAFAFLESKGLPTLYAASRLIGHEDEEDLHQSSRFPSFLTISCVEHPWKGDTLMYLSSLKPSLYILNQISDCTRCMSQDLISLSYTNLYIYFSQFHWKDTTCSVFP
jgi:hypothetical protein